MKNDSTDRLERQIDIKAPVSRVWRALTDYREFGEWFQVQMQKPFVPGQTISGRVLYPGYEHIPFEITIQKMEPEKYFSFHWHPFAVDPKVDYSKEPPTLVEFHLTPTPGGTQLKVTESGFDSIPQSRRDEAYRMNTSGWEEQLENISKYATTPK